MQHASSLLRTFVRSNPTRVSTSTLLLSKCRSVRWLWECGKLQPVLDTVRFPGRVSQFLHWCIQYSRRHLCLLNIYNMRRRCLFKFPLIYSLFLFQFLSWRTACIHHKAAQGLKPSERSWSQQSGSCAAAGPRSAAAALLRRGQFLLPEHVRWMMQEGNIGISC